MITQLPVRVRGRHSSNFKKARIVANHYYLDVEKVEKVVIFSAKFTPFIPSDNTKLRRQILDKLRPQLSNNIKNPVMCGNNIYSLEEAKQK